MGILFPTIEFLPLKTRWQQRCFLAEAYIFYFPSSDRVYHFPSNFPIYLKSGGDGYLVEITTKNGKVRDLDFVILTLESKKAPKKFHSFHYIGIFKNHSE